MMPAISRTKTYSKARKNVHNYSTSSQNSFLFPITGASTAIDSLLAKNIEKRNSSLKEDEEQDIIKTRKRTKKVPEVRLLENDSFDISINTTFEKLQKAPDLHPVQYYSNMSLFSGNSSTENSVKTDDKHFFKVQKTYERKIKTNALSVAKQVKNQKAGRKNLLQMVKKIKTPELSVSVSSVARKFTPIASTSQLRTSKTKIFQPGFRHCMQASPNCLIASTPLISRVSSMRDFSLSPITAKKLNFKSGWKSLFEENSLPPSTSLIKDDDDKNNVILINSSISENNSIIKNDAKFKQIPVVLIEDNLENKLTEELDLEVKRMCSAKVNLTRNSFSEYRNKIFRSPYIDLTRYSFSELRTKRQSLQDNSTQNIKINLRSKTQTKNRIKQKKITTKTATEGITITATEGIPITTSTGGIGLRTRSHQLKTDCDSKKKCPTIKKITKNETKKDKSSLVPIRRLRSSSVQILSSSENDSVSPKNKPETRILRTRSITTDSRRQKSNIKGEPSVTSKKGEASSKIKNVSNNTNKNESVLIDSSTNKNDESIYIANFIELLKNPIKISTPSLEPLNEVNTIRRSSRTRRKSVLIDEELYSDWGEFQRISQNQTSPLTSKILKPARRTRCSSLIETINISDCSAKSLFSSASIIATSEVKPKSFVTTRRGSSKDSSKDSIKELTKLKHPTASLHDWEKFSQTNISTIKIDDDHDDSDKFSIKTTKDDEPNVIEDTFAEENLFLKPGKQWLRSLSILRRTNIHDLNARKNSNKGRKWRESVCAVFDQQNRLSGGGVLIDKSDNQHNEIYNITKNYQISRINSLSRRTTLQIVPISSSTQKKEVSICRDVSSILEVSETLSNKSGYVSTLADESQSILASFDKLSLTTNVEEREETARQIILKRCGQTTPLSFDDCYSQRLLTRCRKIGEGVYGEVFMYKSLDRQCRVMKIIPIEGNQVVNGEHQKKFEEIISEIIIASELSNLRNNKEFSTNGFNELLKICCVQGKYPQHLLDLWNLYDEEQGSENDSPEIFIDEQLYIVLELANGGQDLEAYRFTNAEQSFAVFAQVVCSLAVAESALQFEHRDMHWGNILISPTTETTTTFRLNGRELEIATKGVNVSIIDFTLSRMTYNNCCIFNDLALDPDLFTATGDYQFDIYRLMRQRNLDDWQRFEPYSNILWLDYTLEKMITQLRYLRINTKTHKTNIRRLTQMRKKIFNYNSATELLNSDAFSQVFLY